MMQTFRATALDFPASPGIHGSVIRQRIRRRPRSFAPTTAVDDRGYIHGEGVAAASIGSFAVAQLPPLDELIDYRAGTVMPMMIVASALTAGVRPCRTRPASTVVSVLLARIAKVVVL